MNYYEQFDFAKDRIREARDVEIILYRIIRAIRRFETNTLTISDMKELKGISDLLSIRNVSLAKGKLYRRFSDLGVLGQLPAKNWLNALLPLNMRDTWKKIENENFKEIVNYGFLSSYKQKKTLNDAGIGYYLDKQSQDKRDEEQEIIVKIRNLLELYIMDDEQRRKLYEKIRLNTVAKNGAFDDRGMPNSNIWSSREFDRFIDDISGMLEDYGIEGITLKIERILQLVKSLFRFEIGEKVIHICPYCKMPMVKNQDGYRCLRPNICEMVTDRNVSKIVLSEGEKVYMPTEGVHFYHLLPGISEQFAYLTTLETVRENVGLLEDIEVVMYPGCDRIGDIALYRKGDIEPFFVIDVKDYEDFRNLKKQILQNPSAYTNKDFVYIPAYRTENGLNNRFSDVRDTLGKVQPQRKIEVGNDLKLKEVLSRMLR